MQVSVKNVSKILQILEKTPTKTNNKMVRVCEIVAKKGYEEATKHFSTAKYDGINDVVVNAPYWKSTNRLVLEATGKAVTFIEFGTGADSTHHPYDGKYGFIRGGYGKGKGINPPWFYWAKNGNVLGSTGFVAKNKKGEPRMKDGMELVGTYGNPPARAMYYALESMIKEISIAIREVIND